MAKKTIKYKDLDVPEGTMLYSLLESGETKKAESLYKELMKEFYKYFPKEKREKIGNLIQQENENRKNKNEEIMVKK